MSQNRTSILLNALGCPLKIVAVLDLSIYHIWSKIDPPCNLRGLEAYK